MAEGNKNTKKKRQQQDEEPSEAADSATEEESESQMSEESFKQVRDRYRHLMQTVQEQADRAGRGGVDIANIRNMVNEANQTFPSVKRPREAALDAQFLKTCGVLAKLNIESSQSSLTVFRPSEFAQKLMHFMRRDTESSKGQKEIDHASWRRFGRAVSSLFKKTSGIEPMLGALEWEKPKAVRKARIVEKDKEVQKKTPTEVANVVNGEERQTEEVLRLYRILNRRYHESGNRPVCFFSFVVNPDSYPLTAENLFHTSFLIREQHAVVEEGEHGIPVISPREQGLAPVVGGISSQCIVSISEKDWRDIVKTFCITQSMIPSPASRAKKRKS
ncbi:non-structural maintenance of chromosomes element 4 homolog A-like isoform X2 [Penaeus japonicus]|uniref:non-structural maintenance of chromosomes element 4 homolog A-like isoform X2 n=1 Tax=Penaeus japonicus TaxID=27405 RepID=UPI001C71542C|nr:non-structural maintenance of chromosomes element 4 homolog A-like isoform X2 [Penaeus japonicus]XP_042871616.1 non-structural maintenance of chromosomes element 4 homolog A-like isoform X2 [Penaeus japonicus]XP_042871617.1 non-structural maintenance of chromosomes element 4 homolog A-like isoform X2 [Penaeus japonicus]